MTSQHLLQELETVCKRLQYGCGNGGCRINQPKGQHTNMICQCTPSSFSKRLLALAIEAEEQGREWEKPCDHEPSEPIAAFWFTCKHCGEEIEGVECRGCCGSGSVPDLDDKYGILHQSCPDCHGTGIDHWEVVK